MFNLLFLFHFFYFDFLLLRFLFFIFFLVIALCSRRKGLATPIDAPSVFFDELLAPLDSRLHLSVSRLGLSDLAQVIDGLPVLFCSLKGQSTPRVSLEKDGLIAEALSMINHFPTVRDYSRVMLFFLIAKS